MTNRPGYRVFTLTVLAMSAWLATSAVDAAAHPFHVSVAEAEWNAETRRLEVALRLAPEDLEAALSQRSDTKVRLEDSEQVDAMIVDYLNAHFSLRKTNEEEEPRPLALKWIGKEVSTKSAWLYFEIDAPDGVAGLELRNDLLVDHEETQINTVVLREGQRKLTLRFDKKHTAEIVTFEERPER